MLTLCLSSAPSETGLCLSGGWLLNQTLTFSFLGHLAHQMHKLFLPISRSVCTVCHITYSLVLSSELLCLYRGGRVKNGFQVLWYCMRQEDCLRFWQQSFSATSIETQLKKWIDEWIEGEGRYWSCFMSSPVWLVRRRRGAATCVFVPRSSITTLMSKVTISLSIKSKTNKRQKMMHHPNTASPLMVAANKNNDNQIDLSKRTQALLQTGVGVVVALNTIQPYRVS